jgi:hypothetical protein
MKLIDLSGQKFGRWSVLLYSGNRKWSCRCECGNTKDVNSYSLKSGDSKSCGCLDLEMKIERNKNTGNKHIGEQFGRLTVVERKVKSNGNTKYLCLCECGNSKEVAISNLLNGTTKSCGCYRTEVVKKRVQVDHSGKKFGRLTVIKRVNTSGSGRYLCLCDCGKYTEVLGGALTQGRTKSCGCYGREMAAKGIKDKLSGSNSKFWKGGVVDKNIALYGTFVGQLEPIEEVVPVKSEFGIIFKVRCKKCSELFIPTRTQARDRANAINGTLKSECNFYCSDECKDTCEVFQQKSFPKNYKKKISKVYVSPFWKRSIIERDNFECQICGSKANLYVHHIEPSSEYPMLANDIDNGITLCKICHYKKAHSDGRCKPVNINKCK